MQIHSKLTGKKTVLFPQQFPYLVGSQMGNAFATHDTCICCMLNICKTLQTKNNSKRENKLQSLSRKGALEIQMHTYLIKCFVSGLSRLDKNWLWYFYCIYIFGVSLATSNNKAYFKWELSGIFEWCVEYVFYFN